jgi:gluconate 2-dehydrogenase gamma chain
MPMTRRALIASATLIPVAAIRGAGQTPVSESRNAVSLAPNVFSEYQRRTLVAFVDRLIPKDELGPSASECGVPDYIERSLADYLTAERTPFLQSLAAVDILSRSSQGAPLADLPADKQDEVLLAMENDQIFGLRPMFNRVRRLTLEGMFGDPSYGGNRNFAGWDLQ